MDDLNNSSKTKLNKHSTNDNCYVSNNNIDGWSWHDGYVCQAASMREQKVYGSNIWDYRRYDTAEAQIPLFRFNEDCNNNKSSCWLRDIDLDSEFRYIKHSNY